ncbi:hypothetical protein PPERSA_08482 [Pseudocohnilembus persalinus]|uniref:Uncharacterized protein n=1 Tax=Pseudocohnilembus persalinus TaxID=266149 RepID=A0A0V0R6E9_PSEPJ|nr:hypothetical protein PPERSA_08482 [Pseudocohnilembus persalinus]|eukprot:KRX10079.1 hypothetical protein PPERSA_08482 [Pseudocohnilembus persalinus]
MDRKQPSLDEKNQNGKNIIDFKESVKQLETCQKKKTIILSTEQALQNFIDRIENLMFKIPAVGHLLYLYLKEQGYAEILENENFSKLEFSTRKLAEAALEHNLYIIARIGLNGKNLKSSDKDLLKIALRSNSTGSIKLISKMLLGGGPLLIPLEQIFILEINEQIVQLVKNKHDKAAKNPETFVHGIYFLQFFSVFKLTDQYMLKIVDILEDYLDNKILIFARSISPLSTASVLCDFVDNLVPRFKRYFNRLNALRDRLKQIGITFMEEIQDSLALEITYFKQILPAKNNLFLSYGLASEFMLKKFNGKYKSDYNFMVASSTLKTLKGQNTQPVVKAESSKITQIYQSKGPKNFFGNEFSEDLVTMDIWDAIKLLDQDYIEEVEEMQLDEQNLENDLQMAQIFTLFKDDKVVWNNNQNNRIIAN